MMTKVDPSNPLTAISGKTGPAAVPLPGPSTDELGGLLFLKRILVPIDFSECSKKALQYAVPLARQFRAELTLLNVIHPYVPVSTLSPLPMAMPEGDGAGLKELQVSIGDSVPSATLTRFGEAWAEIVAVAKEQGADLIVISTHGRTGFEHALLGSTTEKVVRHAPCPVLVVRQREHEFVAGPASGQLSSNAFPDRGSSQISG